MSRAEPEHDLARGLEGKEIRLKNNTTTPLSRAASMDSQFHESNALAGKDRRRRSYRIWGRERPGSHLLNRESDAEMGCRHLLRNRRGQPPPVRSCIPRCEPVGMHGNSRPYGNHRGATFDDRRWCPIHISPISDDQPEPSKPLNVAQRKRMRTIHRKSGNR